MATLSTIHPTLMDVAKRLDPDGKIDTIVEILAETNEILEDMVWMEGNLPTGHRTTIRSGLPAPTWRKLYGGVQPTKSRTVQVTDTCGMLEAYAEVDKALADLNGNTAAFRLSEDRAHIEGMNQEFASSLFYASEATAPEEITGFAPRFNLSTAENGENIIRQSNAQPDGTDNASIWLICWGENTCHGIYPYVVRIQYNSEDLVGDAASGPDLLDLMTQALDVPPSLTLGRPAFYMNRRARSFLRRQMLEKVAGSTLTMEQIGGKLVLAFAGIPVRRCDALLNTETGVA